MSKKAVNKFDEGIYLAEELTTYADWAEYWMMELRLKLKPSSIAIYQRTLDRYVLPAFGNRNLTELTSEVIESIGDEWAEYLRPTVIHTNLSLLNRSLKAAVEQELLTENPCQDVNRVLFNSVRFKKVPLFGK